MFSYQIKTVDDRDDDSDWKIESNFEELIGRGKIETKIDGDIDVEEGSSHWDKCQDYGDILCPIQIRLHRITQHCYGGNK